MPSDDDTTLRLAAEDGWDDESCPVCGTAFDSDTWPLESHGGDAWGGSATHSCPTLECDGAAVVTY